MNEWISITDKTRKPPRNKQIFVYCSEPTLGADRMFVATKSAGEFIDENLEKIYYVTHWMLPEPPKI